VTAGDFASFRVQALNSGHDRHAFSCGVDLLDRYLRAQAGQEARKRISTTFVLLGPEGDIAGYYTLSATSIALGELPGDVAKRLPKYPLVPATLLGRLAVDRRHRGKGLGRFMLADAFWRTARSEIATFAVVVEAKDEAARDFYRREGFLPLPDRPLKLFLPMAAIMGLFRSS
jgi:GNAT superfamily N-acetyltransferase